MDRSKLSGYGSRGGYANTVRDIAQYENSIRNNRRTTRPQEKTQTSAPSNTLAVQTKIQDPVIYIPQQNNTPAKKYHGTGDGSLLKRPEDKLFNEFLAKERKKFYEELDKKNSLFTGNKREDRKAQKYIDSTTVDDIDKQSISSSMLTLIPLEPNEDDYGFLDWYNDAWTAFNVKRNEGQIGNFDGKVIRSGAMFDDGDALIEENKIVRKFDLLDQYLKLLNQYDNITPQQEKENPSLKRSLQRQIKPLEQQVRQLYNIDPDVDMRGYRIPLLNEWSELAKTKAERPALKNIVDRYEKGGLFSGIFAKAKRNLGLLLHDGDTLEDLKGSVLGKVQGKVGKEYVNMGIRTGDLGLTTIGLMSIGISEADKRLWGITDILFGDDVDELNEHLAGIQNKSLDQQDATVRKYQDLISKKQELWRAAAEENEKDKQSYLDKHTISQVFRNRTLRAQQSIQNGGNIWTADNLLYNQVEQLGFSASSMDKQIAGMGLQIGATFASGGSSVLLSATGAALGIQGGQEENNMEVATGNTERLKKILSQDSLDLIVEEGRKRFGKDATEDDILQKIAAGRWLPSGARTNKSISEDVKRSLSEARVGAEAVYQRDMAAVAGDEAFDMLLYMAKMPKGFTSVFGKLTTAATKYKVMRAVAPTVNAVRKSSVGKYVVDHAAGAGSWFEKGTKSGIGIGAGVVGATGKIMYNVAKDPVVYIGKKAANTKLIQKIGLSQLAKTTRDGVSKTVDFVQSIPTKLLANTSKEAAFKLNRIAKAGKTVLKFGGKVAASGYSEAIEEGKQNRNSGAWVNNEDPERVVGFFDTVLKDLELGSNLVLPALGIPFSQQWGLAKDGDLYSEMSGGFLGGAMHTAAISAPGDLVTLAGDVRQISLAKLIASNTIQDKNQRIVLYLDTRDLAKKVMNSPSAVLAEIDEFRKFNSDRREANKQNGTTDVLDVVDDDAIDAMESYAKYVASIARSALTKQQAEKAGISISSPEYYKFVALKAMEVERYHEAKDRNAELKSKHDAILNNITSEDIEAYENEAAMLMDVYGETANNDDPIVALFKREPKEGEEAETDSEVFKRGVASLTEISALENLLSTIETAESFNESRNKHDIGYIKKQIKNRISKLRDTMNDKNADVESQLSRFDEEAVSQMKDLYHAMMANTIDMNVARMMDNLLGSKMTPHYDKETKRLLFSYDVKNVKDVLKYLDSVIEDTYDTIDVVNREFEERNMGKVVVEPEEQPEDTEEQALADEILSAAEEEAENEIVVPESSPEPVITPETPSTPEPSVEPEPIVPNPTPTPSVVPEPVVPEPAQIPEPIVSIDELNDAIDLLREGLAEEGLSDSQSKLPAANPKLIQAGIQIMLNTIQNGLYQYDEAVVGVYDTLKQYKISDAAILTLIPYFKQWYAAATMNPAIIQHIDKTNSLSEIAKTDESEIISRYEYEHSTLAQQEQQWQQFRQDLASQEGLIGVFESMSDALSAKSVNAGDRFAIANKDDKSYKIYTIQSIKNNGINNVVNEDGILVVSEGVELTADQVAQLYAEANNNNSDLNAVFDDIEAKIKEDNDAVVGVSGHDYFIREADGKTRMYPRVHTIIGDMFESMPEWEDVKKQLIQDIEQLLKDGKYDEVEKMTSSFKDEFGHDVTNNIKDIEGFNLYIDQAKNVPEDIPAIAEALASLLSRPTPGVGVEVGNIVDELARLYFDSDPESIKSLRYDTLKLKLRGKDIPVLHIMSKVVFDNLMDDFRYLKQLYDYAGFKISTKKHVWHSIITLPDGTSTRVAGETDMVAVDSEGRVHIIDTKTSKRSFGHTIVRSATGEEVDVSNFYNTPDLFGVRKKIWNYNEHYSRQLSAYVMLIQSAMPNIQFAENPIELLPVRVDYNFGETSDLILNYNGTQRHVIFSMYNGRYTEPSRISLLVVPIITSVRSDNDETIAQKLQQIKQILKDLNARVKLIFDDCSDKYHQIFKEDEDAALKITPIISDITELKQKILHLANQVVDVSDPVLIENIYNEIQELSHLIDQLEQHSETLYQEALNSIKPSVPDTLVERTNDYNRIMQLAQEAYDSYVAFNDDRNQNTLQVMNDKFTALINAVRQFDQTYENPVEISDTIRNNIQWFLNYTTQLNAPKKPQQTVSAGGYGWREYNTADRYTVWLSRATDDPNLRLLDVTAEPDFGTKSVTEVIDTTVRTDKFGTTNIIRVQITYNGHTYSPIDIQVANNSRGQDIMQQLAEAKKNAKPGDKIVLTGMDRSEGKYTKGLLQYVVNSPLISSDMSLYDISTEFTQSMFGLSKIDKSTGQVRVLAQGSTVSGATLLWQFPQGNGTAGVIYAMVVPNYNNNSRHPLPYPVPIISNMLTQGDVDLLVDLFRLNKGENYYVQLPNGNDVAIPFTVKELIQLFIPIGTYDGKYNNATYVRFEGSTVIFSSKNGEVMFDSADERSSEGMKKWMMLNVRMNINEEVLNCRLGEATSGQHPFKRMATWFNRHPECSTIKIGKSTVVFNRSDFKNPKDPSDTKGLSGLGWMIKNGMLSTEFAGFEDPRFSYNNVEVQSQLDVPVVGPENAPVIAEPEFSAEDADFEFDYDEGSYHVQVGSAKNKISKEQVIRRMQRIFGKSISVEVVENIYDMHNRVMIGVVGRMFKNVMTLCERAENGTEYHEAFHGVYDYLLPEFVRKLLYKGIKKAIARRYGKQSANNFTDRQIIEFGANECARYMLKREKVMNSIMHPFDFIKGHYDAYLKIGSFRMYLLYVSMYNGAFKDKQFKVQNPNVAQNYKFQVHNVGFDHIYDDKQYDTLKRSMLYYIMKCQKIRKDGKNINNLDLSSDIFDIEHTFKKPKKDRNGKQLFKDGKPVIEEYKSSIRQMLMASCKSELGKRAAEEAIEKWDTVKKDIITYLGEMGIDYNESILSGEIVEKKDAKDIEIEEELLAGDFDNNTNGIKEHTQDANEASHITRASSGIRFFTSMIKHWTVDKEGNQIEARNELGFYEFMDSKEVLCRILGDCHDISSPTEMIERFRDLAKSDKMYKLIYEYVNHMYKNVTNKEGKVNANTEQFITQLYNLVSCYNMTYKRISAIRDNKSGQYALSVENCGQEYEARQHRSNWGHTLMYGANKDLFAKNQDDKFAPMSERSIDYMGSVFDKLLEIKQQFTQQNISKLQQEGENAKPTLRIKDGGKVRIINITNEDDLIFLKRAITQMFNYLCIDISVPELDYLLKHKYQELGCTTLMSLLNAFFNETEFADIANLWASDVKLITKNNGKWQWNVDINNNIYGTNIPAENIYVNNSFCSELSRYKYAYQHESSDLSVLVSAGNRYYQISENNMISDVTNEISKNGPVVDMLKKFCYNFVESVGQDEKGNTIKSQEGSLIVKQVANQPEGKRTPLRVCTLVQFKTNQYGDEGSGYFDISEREDYTAKATILENGCIVFPTMSDKKSWCYLEGVNLPGIEYGKDKNNNLVVKSHDEDEVLELLVEYADTEYFSIKQTLQQIKDYENNPEKKVNNFHIGTKKTTVIDKDGVKHTVPGGTVFLSLSGVYDKNLKYIPFNRLLDENGKYISPEDNLKKAEEYFFSLKHEQKKAVIKRILDVQTKKELEHLEELGLVKKNKYNPAHYDNVGLNRKAILLLARAMFDIKPQQSVSFVHEALATERYVRDIVSKSIMSIQEIERVYSGNPAFFKLEFTSDGRLIDRSVDEFKRLGGLISTGVNNNTEIQGIPEDGMYVCAEVNNEETGSEQIEKIRELMSIGEWKLAYLQLGLTGDVSNMSLEEIMNAVKKANNTVYEIVKKKLSKEVESYEGGIDIADGGAYISPEMTEWLLRMCGEYDRKVLKAFETLNNPKSNIFEQADAYKLVTTKVIGAQKYTAYGMRLSEDGKTTIPYYNKMALFPVFKCIATGKFAKLYDQMNKQGVHMLMINSAVKVGSQGSLDYSTDNEFKFNTYKQEFKYLRKQFNTNPHHKEEQGMGTQMVKVALASLMKNHTYTKEDGTPATGEELLAEIMQKISELSKFGKKLVDEALYVDGEIDPEKLSKFLHEQLSSRDADKSILDSISLITKGGVNMLKHPLAAISRMSWLLSILVSYINKRIVDVNTQGNAFYQRSVWNMEGVASQYLDDDNLPADLNEGKNLEMIIENGPAKGAMDCILTIDYFEEVLKEAGLQDASFNELKQALIDAGIIGPKAKANFIGYRIPTQAQSSIHPLRCVDVLPVIQHNIILPKEFTKITGSDFDIDKIYIGSLNFKLKKEGESWINDEKAIQSDVRKRTQNELINDYITILKEPDSTHIAHRSIDNDTDLLKDVLADIESNRPAKQEVETYDFYCLRTHTRSKNDFLTGKTGIGPFALNNNSLILTTLYNVRFKEESIMNLLGHDSLHDTVGDDSQSILSWISALINAHVDIAKDPYISRLNVNQMTYNLTNLLIRTGYGKNTFYFLTQPVMILMAAKYRQAQGKFMLDQTKSSYQIQKEAKYEAAKELCGEKALKDVHDMLYENIDGKDVYTKDFLHLVTAVLNNKYDVSRKCSKGYSGKVGIKLQKGFKQLTQKEFQALVYWVDNALEKPAQAISDLVKYSKIDTKKQGKNISEQLAYLDGVQRVFGDNDILTELYGIEVEDEYRGEFELSSIRNMYENSFIKLKTHDAIFTFMDIIKGQVLEATPAFQNVVQKLSDMLGRRDSKSIATISNAVSAKLKSIAINQYAEDNGIDIKSLVSGDNTIYDRLNTLSCAIKANPEKYKALYDYSGEIRNPLLRMLIADKHWLYNPASHLGSAKDKLNNLKFVRLLDALDMSSSKTDYIIQAWDDLLNDNNYPEIKQFARDLCVYAFVTSGDQGGRTKLFLYVPNSWREQSGYVDHMRRTLERLQNPSEAISLFDADFIDDVVLNNTDNYTFVPVVNIDKKSLPNQPTWKPVYRKASIQYGDETYVPGFPIFLTVDNSTPMDHKEIKPYIKIKRSKYPDGSNRSYTVFKLVTVVPVTKTSGIPIYVKVNPRGYHLEGGYDYYEYGQARTSDHEYFPSVNGILNMVKQIRQSADIYKQTYGETFMTVVENLASNVVEDIYNQSEEWVGQQRTYNPEPIKQPAEQPETINIYAGTNENADLSNFAERPFTINREVQNELAAIVGKDWAETMLQDGDKFHSVENAFQFAKSSFAWEGNSNYAESNLNEFTKIAKVSPKEAKSLGRKIKLTKEGIALWDSKSSQIMKVLLRESFKQNPQSLQRLLDTGNATLTHTQDKGKWGKEFPKLLMEVREELRSLNTNYSKNNSNKPVTVKDLIITGSANTTKQKAQQIGGIDTLRHSNSEGMHFGNPFSHTNYAGVQKVMPNVKEAVIAFEQWLRGEAYQDIEPDRRQWILDQINSGVLDDKPLVYYTDKIPDNSYGRAVYDYNEAPNHAHILQKLINEHINSKNTTPQELLRNESTQPKQTSLLSAIDVYKDWVKLENGQTASQNKQFAESTNVPKTDAKGFRTQSSSQVLDDIINNTLNSLYKSLAQWLKSKVAKHEVTVFFTNNDGGNIQSGVTHTVPQSDGSIIQSIEINTNSELYKQHPEQTLLHEILHSVSSVVVKLFRSNNKSVDFNEYIAYIKEQVSAIDPNIVEQIYGLSSAEEFVSEFYTNPAFLNLLKAIPAMDQQKFESMFHQVIDWIRRVVDMVLGNPTNAFQQIKPIMNGIVSVEETISFSNKTLGPRLLKSVNPDSQRVNATKLQQAKENIKNKTYSIDDVITLFRDKGFIKLNGGSIYLQKGFTYKDRYGHLLYQKDLVTIHLIKQALKDNGISDIRVTTFVDGRVKFEQVDHREEAGWYDSTDPVSDLALRELELDDDQQLNTKDDIKQYLKAMGEQLLKTQCRK